MAEADTAGVVVIGAGPAGLAAGETLATHGRRAIVVEASEQVGGIAKTVQHDGFRFDLGGHRFFTKFPSVERLWSEVLGEEFLLRPRLSRIYFRRQFLAYPLRAEDVVKRLGVLESLRCAFSYAASRLRRTGVPETFEEWVTARFGRRLYNAFFREYTEKVWGIPGSEIQSEWAAQRIKNLSFPLALASALRLRRAHVTSLIEQFHYPRLGPGQMWEALAERLVSSGVPVRLGVAVRRIHHSAGRVTAITVATSDGEQLIEVDGIVSTMALPDLIRCLDPPVPPGVLASAAGLRYRDLVVVGLMSDVAAPFPDNWIYLHDPGVRAGRVQNFGAWSPDMTRPGHSSLGVEYFCFEGGDLWSATDAELVTLAREEMATVGLIDPSRVIDGVVIRVAKAYPMYDEGYAAAVQELRKVVESFENLETAGRNGLHRYNNQDHSMVTGAMAAMTFVDGRRRDVWAVGTEPEYLEEIPLHTGSPAGDQRVPDAGAVVVGTA